MPHADTRTDRWILTEGRLFGGGGHGLSNAVLLDQGAAHTALVTFEVDRLTDVLDEAVGWLGRGDRVETINNQRIDGPSAAEESSLVLSSPGPEKTIFDHFDRLRLLDPVALSTVERFALLGQPPTSGALT